MTKPSNFTSFIDTLTQELIDMPDEQVLEGRDAAQLHANAQAILKAARAEAGRRRLAAAKAGVSALRTRASTTNFHLVGVSPDEARRLIAKAQNDSRYTLAARKLGEMTDDEVLRLYSQIKHLEDSRNRGGD